MEYTNIEKKGGGHWGGSVLCSGLVMAGDVVGGGEVDGQMEVWRGV